jgi:acyl carrier protein
MNAQPTLDEVKQVLVETLAVDDRASSIGADTPLLDGLPELDSMGVVALAVALEERFGITVEDDDMRAEVFDTLGSLTEMVRQRADASGRR